MEPHFKAVADHALMVTFADQISDTAHASVIALDQAIRASQPNGVIETVPALINILIAFDPLATDHLILEQQVRRILENLITQTAHGAQRRIQICYEAPFSPDLSTVAAKTDLTTEAVIKAHLAGDYRVSMYGFAPGYAYLSGVSENIQVPRKTAAVRNVPAGSVIIAGPQCLITTLTMPTGWSIIGRSPAQIFTGDPEHPFLFDVGDQVIFERIDLSTFETLSEGTHG